MSFKTLVYSPQIRILIVHDGVEYDVSADIIRGTLVRKTNSVSTIAWSMANRNLRYTSPDAVNGVRFARMDRMTVWMKRFTWVQVFTGYLDSVPHLQLYPGTVEFRASCTLKRLLHTYWNPGLPQSSELLRQASIAASGPDEGEAGNKLATDSGLGAMMRGILMEVGNWKEDQISIADIPAGFVEYVSEGVSKAGGDPQLEQLKKLFGFNEANSVSGGASNGGSIGPPDGDAYTPEQIVAIAEAAGFTGDGLINAVAVCLAESGGRPAVTNTVGNSAGTDQGLWQINSYYHPEWPAPAIFDPATNAAAAFKISSGGTNWQPWSTFSHWGTYAKHLDTARAAVAAPRVKLPAGTGQSNAPASGTTNPNPGAPTTTNPTPTVPGAPKRPDGSVIDERLKPVPDSEGAVQYALSKIGCPYVWGANSETEFDCSSLTQRAYRAIGISIGRTTYDQASAGKKISRSQLQRGDLIQPTDGHTVIYLGGNQVVHAPTTGQNVKVENIWWSIDNSYSMNNLAQNGGADPNAPYGNPEGELGGTGTGTSAPNGAAKLAQNLFSWIFSPEQFITEMSQQLKGERSLIADEPLMQITQSIMTASMRNFSSAPNGDFVAWYPDYFGIDKNNKAVLQLEDIEMQDVKINLSDDPLTTHVFVAGDFTMVNAPVSIGGWMATAGIATVETQWLFKRLIAYSPGMPDNATPQDILSTFGARPFSQSYSNIASPVMEFMIAVQVFMQKWAEQYATTVQFTFMPELFPGMRINMAGHNLQVYVSEVSHNFDYAAGFSTSAVISSPSNPNGKEVATELAGISIEELARREKARNNDGYTGQVKVPE